MHEELKLSTLHQRRCQHIINTTHKLLNGIGPPDCIDMLIYVHEVHAIPTRWAQGDLLYVPPTRLKSTKRNFAYTAPNVWNQIPAVIRLQKSHEKSEKQIKNIKFNWLSASDKLACMLSKTSHTKCLLCSYHSSSSIYFITYTLNTVHYQCTSSIVRIQWFYVSRFI